MAASSVAASPARLRRGQQRLADFFRRLLGLSLLSGLRLRYVGGVVHTLLADGTRQGLLTHIGGF